MIVNLIKVLYHITQAYMDSFCLPYLHSSFLAVWFISDMSFNVTSDFQIPMIVISDIDTWPVTLQGHISF